MSNKQNDRFYETLMEAKAEGKRVIKYTAWYCPNGDFGHCVIYKATGEDVENHLKECGESQQKKDWCDRSEKPTFQDKFGEILHGGYGYAR